jgi:hypothetical protein
MVSMASQSQSQSQASVASPGSEVSFVSMVSSLRAELEALARRQVCCTACAGWGDRKGATLHTDVGLVGCIRVAGESALVCTCALQLCLCAGCMLRRPHMLRRRVSKGSGHCWQRQCKGPAPLQGWEEVVT